MIRWIWNWRHRKLIEETKRLLRTRLFLDECGLSEYHFSVEELKRVETAFKKQ